MGITAKTRENLQRLADTNPKALSETQQKILGKLAMGAVATAPAPLATDAIFSYLYNTADGFTPIAGALLGAVGFGTTAYTGHLPAGILGKLAVAGGIVGTYALYSDYDCCQHIQGSDMIPDFVENFFCHAV